MASLLLLILLYFFRCKGQLFRKLWMNLIFVFIKDLKQNHCLSTNVDLIVLFTSRIILSTVCIIYLSLEKIYTCFVEVYVIYWLACWSKSLVSYNHTSHHLSWNFRRPFLELEASNSECMLSKPYWLDLLRKIIWAPKQFYLATLMQANPCQTELVHICVHNFSMLYFLWEG